MLTKTISHFLAGVALSAAVSGCSGLPNLNEKPDLRPFEKPLAINTRPKRMAIGNGFVVAIKEDGTVWSWGSGYYGQLGTGKEDWRHFQPKQLPQLSEMVEVATGIYHVLALKSDGTVWAWGKGWEWVHKPPFSVKTGDKKVYIPTKIVGVANVKRIAATSNGYVFLTKDGDLIGWGNNEGDPFNSPEKIVATPTVYAHVPDAVSLFSGVDVTGVIRADGSIVTWGRLNQVDEKTLSTIKIADINTVGFLTQILAQDGFVYAATSTSTEVLGQGKPIKGGGFMRVKNLGRIVQIADVMGPMALDETGRVWQWGASVLSEPDPGGNGVTREYTPIVTFKLTGVSEIYPWAAFTRDGSVYFWGQGQGGVRTRDWQDHRPSQEEWTQPEKINWTWK